MYDADGPVSPNFAEDADHDHPWARRYRIPLIRGTQPRWPYEVAVSVLDDSENSSSLSRPVWPTEDEARVIAALIDYRRDYYNGTWSRRMLARPFDVDGGTNTLVLVRTAEGWSHRMASWDRGPHLLADPDWTPDVPGLLRMADHRFAGSSRWAQWKDSRPEVFTQAVGT